MKCYVIMGFNYHPKRPSQNFENRPHFTNTSGRSLLPVAPKIEEFNMRLAGDGPDVHRNA